MRRVCDNHPSPARSVQCHDDRFGHCGGTVVEGSVGHLHARETADHRLEFEEGLQRTLRRFSLVGGVGGEKSALRCKGINGGGNEVVVGAAAEKATVDRRCRRFILPGARFQFSAQIQFGQGGSDVQRTVKTVVAG